MIKLYYTFSNPDSDAFIRAALKKFTGRDGFVIKRTENGKPHTVGAEFSLSHTDGLTVCAVSDRAVGADCERVRSVSNKEKILTRFLKEAPQDISDTEFFGKWTAFESRVKYFGEKIADCPSVFNKSIFTETFELGAFTVSVSAEKKSEIEKENLNGSF